jgi:hypothetical protein
MPLWDMLEAPPPAGEVPAEYGEEDGEAEDVCPAVEIGMEVAVEVPGWSVRFAVSFMSFGSGMVSTPF